MLHPLADHVILHDAEVIRHTRHTRHTRQACYVMVFGDVGMPIRAVHCTEGLSSLVLIAWRVLGLLLKEIDVLVR